MRRVRKLIILALLVLSWVSFSVQAQEQSQELERIQRATVFIMQAQNVGDSLVVTCVGSGSIVSRSGLIITNAHSTVSSDICPGDVLIIALTVTPGEPPIPKYRAEVAQADPGLDLALLRITRELDGRLVASGSLALPFVELADSSTLQLDQTIVVVGYPGVGNEPVGVARGT
ncbi:MAG: serine protease, partial [Anaerolineae bacterium]|nr:serine protease [Anaerolineae bacterium]